MGGRQRAGGQRFFVDVVASSYSSEEPVWLLGVLQRGKVGDRRRGRHLHFVEYFF